MLPDYPQTATHYPRELYPPPRHSRGLGTRRHNAHLLPITPARPAASAGGKRDDRDRMGGGSSQQTGAGKRWAVPYAATEGGATLAVAERPNLVQKEPRASEHEASVAAGR